MTDQRQIAVAPENQISMITNSSAMAAAPQQASIATRHGVPCCRTTSAVAAELLARSRTA